MKSKIVILFFLAIMCVQSGMCACMHACVHLCEGSEDNFFEPVFSFHPVDFRNQTLIIQSGGKYFYLLSHLASPV